jgi:hypothetical protein
MADNCLVEDVNGGKRVPKRRDLAGPQPARNLVSGLAPCPCGGSDLVGLIRHLGRCLACAEHDLKAADQWQQAYISNEEERSHLRNAVIPKLEQAIRDAIELADTGSEKHRAVFDPYGVGEIPAGWRVVEKMREVLADAVSAG